MAKAYLNYDVTRFCMVFFPVASYYRVGDVRKITVFGIPVYRRTGALVNFCGVQYRVT